LVKKHLAAGSSTTPEVAVISSRFPASPWDKLDTADQASGFAIVSRMPSTFPSPSQTAGVTKPSTTSVAPAGVDLVGESSFFPFLFLPSDLHHTVQIRRPNPKWYRPILCRHVAALSAPQSNQSNLNSNSNFKFQISAATCKIDIK
jgi:hypothetical protein